MKSEQENLSRIYLFLLVLELNQKSRLLVHHLRMLLTDRSKWFIRRNLLISTDLVYILLLHFNVVTKTAKSVKNNVNQTVSLSNLAHWIHIGASLAGNDHSITKVNVVS